MKHPVRLYNTDGREIQRFKPREDAVRVYACGPTVYDYAHLGNLRAYVFNDVLRRTLEHAGYDVIFQMNITDVGHLTDDADQGEDKMEKRSRERGKTVWEIAEFYTDAFKKDLERLNIKSPMIWSVATEHIEEQKALVTKICRNGYGYVTTDGVYFDSKKLSEYGELIPNFDPENLEAGRRVDMKEKRNPTDFALWKFSPADKQRAMEWDYETPLDLWGDDADVIRQTTKQNSNITIDEDKETVNMKGFPGWHVECTAMACEHLGEHFDIHTGGVDHISVHHTAELAQARGAFGDKHADFWLHSEFVNVKDGKMSKSKGNFLRLQTIIDKDYHPLDYRYLCLLTQYRKPIVFSWEALTAARKARLRIEDAIRELLPARQGEVLKNYKDAFDDAVFNDLNTPKALASLQNLIKSDEEPADIHATALYFDEVLGLRLDNLRPISIPEDIQVLAEKRGELRSKGEFEAADDIRDELRRKGYAVRDEEDGFTVTPLR